GPSFEPKGFRRARAVWTWPQPNDGSPAAGAALGCQRAIRVSATPSIPPIAFPIPCSLEVLRVRALDLGVTLATVGGGVELNAGSLRARALGAGEAEHRPLAGAARAAVLLAAVVIGDDDLLGLAAIDPCDVDRGDI